MNIRHVASAAAVSKKDVNVVIVALNSSLR